MPPKLALTPLLAGLLLSLWLSRGCTGERPTLPASWTDLGGAADVAATVTSTSASQLSVFHLSGVSGGWRKVYRKEHEEETNKFVDEWETLGSTRTSELAVAQHADDAIAGNGSAAEVALTGTTYEIEVKSDDLLGFNDTSLDRTSLTNVALVPVGGDDGTHLAVVAKDGDNAVWLRERVSGVWQGWENIGGEITSFPRAVQTIEGSLFVLGVSACGAVVQRRRFKTGEWDGWITLPYFVEEVPAIMPFYAGFVIAFLTKGSKHTFVSTWHAWNDHFNDHDLGPGMIVTPAVATSEPNYVDVFSVAQDGSLTRRTWTRHWQNGKWNGLWNEWHSIDGISHLSIRPAVVARNGSYDLFAVDPDKHVRHTILDNIPCTFACKVVDPNNPE